ncbi:MAG: hypothetical protein ABR551_10690 [Gemmatimonadales bacterium]
MRRFILPLLALLATAPSALPAQFAPLTIPRGRFAIELRTYSESWDHRFVGGEKQPAGTDFTRSPIGADFFPALASAEDVLAALSGTPGQILNLGSFSAIQISSQREFGIGLAIGVTSRLTVSGLVPIRRVRVQTITAFDGTDANAGINPTDPALGTPAGAGATISFFASFDAALVTLADRLASGTWDNDPATRAVAEATLADGQALRNGLYDVMVNAATRSPFLPTAGSLAGAALANRISALQTQFSGTLGIDGFTGQPAFATEALTSEGFNDFLTNPQGPVAGSILAPPFTALGDIELGAAYLLLDRPATTRWGQSLRVAANATVRLRTSQLANPDRFFDIGTGDRQPDVELGMTLDASRGRGALRLSGWYNLQLAGNQLRRIGPPSQPVQLANRSAALSKNPGDVIGITILPAYRFTPRFAFLGGVEWWRRGDDDYQYVEGQVPLDGIDPNLLAEESAASALTLRGGLAWSHPGDGGSPLDASVTWERVISAGGGRVPQSEIVRAMLRIYGRIW